MAASGDRPGPPVASLKAAVDKMAAWIRDAEGDALGEGLIQIREAGIDPLEAVFAIGVRRFDKSGEYKADGALSLTAWLRWKCKLSGGAALERVEISRQLEKLPQTEAAFANGDLGFQHVAVLARTTEHVGTTTLPNLALLCRPHHRMVHEESPPQRRTVHGDPAAPGGAAQLAIGLKGFCRRSSARSA